MHEGGQLHVPAALSPREDPCYPQDRRLGRPQRRPQSGGKRKIPTAAVQSCSPYSQSP